MQIKNIHVNKKPILLIILKVVFLFSSLWYVTVELTSKGSTLAPIEFPKGFLVTVLLCLGMMFLNWGLEALKWKVSVALFEPMSFWKSCKVVLAGLAMNLLIPLTVGDAMARILSLRNKYQATSAIVLNRGIMLTITLLYGTYAVRRSFEEELLLSNILWLLIIGFVAIFIFRKQFTKLAAYFKSLSLRLVSSVLLLSFLRYLIFVIQFFILIRVFMPSLSGETIFLGIGWIFLARSILPSFFGGIGIREASGLLFFSQSISDSAVIVVPIFILWIINTIIPSVLGLLSVWNFRFKIAGWSFLSQG